MNKPNFLINETSPYLIKHAYNPVAWYPWGEEAFKKAKKEDKPIFLSIGYSTCHWCHVMESESFEDEEIAKILNDSFVSIKVDREERPDIDSVYMGACQAMTGSGGWPLTVLMMPEGKPFFAGTYFPKTGKYGIIGLGELLKNVADVWKNKRRDLNESAEAITAAIQRNEKSTAKPYDYDSNIVEKTFGYLSSAFDSAYGGFGAAPKFPAAHNLLFLLEYYKTTDDKSAILMVEKTLISMYKGGTFDHIGNGFCRYSTDKFWLVPHFEKMLYDNALLLSAYVKAYALTKKDIYKTIAEKIISYVFKELTDSSGGFYSAQDADVSGEEGKFYTFSPSEILDVLGDKDGRTFNKKYDITAGGNFENKNIPNLLKSDIDDISDSELISKLYTYRKNRFKLETDDKILTSWNCLMIAALAEASIAFNNPQYLNAAEKAFSMINTNLKSGDALFSGYRQGKHSKLGFLDDYAFYIYACIGLYKAKLDTSFIDLALKMTEKTIDSFWIKNGGFYLSDSEELIFRPVETHDGAMPSGNSVMCYNLVYLSSFMNDKKLYELCNTQIDFMTNETLAFLGGASFFALSYLKSDSLSKLVCVLDKTTSLADINKLSDKFNEFEIVKVLNESSMEYPLKNNKTTFYICKGKACLPPQNEL